MTKPAPLVRIINRGTRWVAFGDYRCGVELSVTPAEAAMLAPKGFVPVAPAAPPAGVTPTITPEE
ncbi:MAG: hypothetical protein KAX51_13195 [Chromatiaceae bacterium]|nr:hypothetical protein [Chromatiaceae bacterium]